MIVKELAGHERDVTGKPMLYGRRMIFYFSTDATSFGVLWSLGHEDQRAAKALGFICANKARNMNLVQHICLDAHVNSNRMLFRFCSYAGGRQLDQLCSPHAFVMFFFPVLTPKRRLVEPPTGGGGYSIRIDKTPVAALSNCVPRRKTKHKLLGTRNNKQ